MRLRIKNKKRFTIILSIVLVLLAMISGTYSLFYHESIAQSGEEYSTGLLSIVAKSMSDDINLTNALPMSDQEGAQSEPYVFNIENLGNLDYNFNIRLLSTSANPINPAYIKLKIDDGEVTTLSALTNSVIKSNITLRAKDNMDITIRIWLASNTPNSEIGKSFNSRIVTEGQAVYTDVNNMFEETLVERIKRLYYGSEKTTVTVSYEHSVGPQPTGYRGKNSVVVPIPSDNKINNSNNSSLYLIDDDPSQAVEETTYSYATSVNLMNDRLGGETESLDGGNIRYYGANPNNYVDIGDRDSNDEVIFWRIIGVFDDKVRIMRSESIGRYSFDTSEASVNGGNGSYYWPNSDILRLLNPGYENNIDYDYDGVQRNINNSLWWTSGSGICYTYRRNQTSACDFTSSGLSNEAKKYVVDQAISMASFGAPSVYIESAYFSEMSAIMYNVSNNQWTGKVGLPYVSDYGYATDLNLCYEIFGNYSLPQCKENNWMYTDDYNETWLGVTGGYFNYYGSINNQYSGYNDRHIFPTLTLNPDVLVKSDADGSIEHPYVIRLTK